jgi:uncharacterized membrane protein
LKRVVTVLGIVAALIEVFVGVATMAVTSSFSFDAFLAATLYDALPEFIAALGIVIGLMIAKRGRASGGWIILVFGLVPLTVLYDIIYSFSINFIPFVLFIFYLPLVVVPIILSSIGGLIQIRNKKPE